MKIILKLLLIFIGASWAASPVSALTIEDDGIAAVSNQINSVIYNDESFVPYEHYSCKIVGEEILLSETQTMRTYFVTTADACGWGAALGPIWLVRIAGGEPSLVLSTGGYSISILKDVKRMMHSVKIESATSARSSSIIYEFNGLVYKRLDKKR